MSPEPSQEDMVSADPNLGIQILKQELAAVGKTIADISDEELGRRARQVGLDADQMQSQFKFKRTPGKGIGIGVEKVKQRTAAQIIRGNQEPPPAFFEGIPEAMQQALAGINQQRILGPTPPKPRDKPPVPTTQTPEATPEATPAPESTAPRPRVKPAAPSRSSSTSGLSTVGRRTTLEENEALRKALGVSEEEVSESLIEKVGNLFTRLLPTREDMLSGMSLLELPRTGLELQRAATENKRSRTEDMTASLQDEMARSRRISKEMESSGLTSPEQTNVVDRDEFNTTPIGTRLRLLAEENLRRNQEAREAIKKEEGTPPKRPVSPRVLDSAAKRFEATLETPRQEQEGTRLSFNQIVENSTASAPKTRASIFDNTAQVGKAGSVDRSSQTNIIKKYLNSMGYSKQDQTKFAKYFFNTFDQDVFFNQDVIIAALKMFNKEN